MAHDDSDRIFEKALARHLRSSAPSGVGANAPAGAPLQSCPDPEILAAYHERSLSSGELILWKEHVVACGHCQFVLARLAATDNIALDASPAQSESLISELAFSRKQRPRDSLSTDSRPVNSRPLEGERRPASWRWVLLIPAGAIAAGLVAWVSLRTPKPLSVSPSSPVQIAENQPAPSVESPPKPALAVPSEHKEKDQLGAPSGGVIGGLISPNRNAVAKAPQNERQLSQQTPSQLKAIPANGPSVNQQMQQQLQEASGSVVASAGAAVRKKLESQAPAGISENAKSIAPPAPPPPPPPQPSEPSFLDQTTVATNSPSRASPAHSASASNVAIPKEKAATADTIGQTSESVEVSAEPQTPAQSKAMLRAAVLQNPHVFVAPDGKHLWRVGPSGSLERSKDEGLKWSLQTTGVTTDLTAGSAPSAKVAWIVGNSGTILRTTDGGAHWTKLDSPVTNDLTGVRATDVFHASIWFVADPQTGVVKTYETADGGATWSAVPNP